jgi:hypothetical protein
MTIAADLLIPRSENTKHGCFLFFTFTSLFKIQKWKTKKDCYLKIVLLNTDKIANLIQIAFDRLIRAVFYRHIYIIDRLFVFESFCFQYRIKHSIRYYSRMLKYLLEVFASCRAVNIGLEFQIFFNIKLQRLTLISQIQQSRYYFIWISLEFVQFLNKNPY